MINKLFPRLLNSSKDSRVRGQTEMKDAYNITVTSDYGDDYGDVNVGLDQDGDEGVMKPAVGNAAQDLSAQFSLDDILENNGGARRVIGKVEDRKTGVIYFFLFSAVLDEMGVYAWDSENYFGSGAEVWRPIYRTPEFNFTSLTRVVGDIVHVSGGSDVDFRPILYFTDDENEPRKLDVLRCVEEGFSPALLNNYQPSDIHDVDFITACPRMPIVPPTFEFFQEAGNRASDFRRVPGVQFAYQCIYAGGEESAISTYSDIAIPEEYLRQGTITGELDLPQLCRITIDPSPYGVLTISEEIVAFKILVRRGNDGPFYVVDEVDKAGPFGTVTTYDFFNDKVLIGITESEEQKQYDNLPRLAQAMSVVENRLFYGNYVEGYDDVPLEGTVTPIYIPTGTTEQAIELNAVPVVTYLGQENVNTNPNNPTVTQQRTAAVAIDTSGIDPILPVGTSISISVTAEPGKNLGLYDVQGGYHNSRITGGVSTAGGYSDVPFHQQFDVASGAYDYGPFGGNQQTELQAPLSAKGLGDGVGGALHWKTTEDATTGAESFPFDVVIGTSAATPLKIKGQPVTFSVEIQTTEVIENAQEQVRLALGGALSGRPELVPAGFVIAQANVNPTYNYNLGLRAPNPDLGEAGAMNLQRLGVGGQPMNTDLAINVTDTTADEDALDMITPVFRKNNSLFDAPCGYIIVNEANVGMRLEFQPNQTADIHGNLILTLEVDSLANVGVVTAIPMLTCPDFRVRQWRIYDGDTLTQYLITDIDYEGLLESAFKFTGSETQSTNAAFFNLGLYDDGFTRRKSLIGYLQPPFTDLTSVSGSDLFIPNRVRREDLDIPADTPALEAVAIEAAVGTSLFDTEGGFQSEIYGVSTHYTDYIIAELEGTDIQSFLGIPVDAHYKLTYTGDTFKEGPISSLMIMRGRLMDNPSSDPNDNNIKILPFLNHEVPETFAAENTFMLSLWGPHINRYAQKTKDSVLFIPAPASTTFNANVTGEPQGQGGSNIGLFQKIVGDLASTLTIFQGDLTFSLDPENPSEQLQEIELLFNGFLEQVDVSGDYRSFKTSSYHDLGVVYYDDRGRPGNVNILPRVYVAGYSNEERGLNKGRVELEINLQSAPPEWAHQYQIVYAGNSTYQDFIQYSIAGAFIDEVGDNDTTRNIYLSLNHLQNDKQVSYAYSYGAVDPNGNKDLYTFVPGDQIRVISFQQNETQTTYPNQLVFDIIDQVTLTGNTNATTEEGRNPLDSGSDNTPRYLQGDFLVIRDNPGVTGFNWSSVRAQGNDIHVQDTAQSNWLKRCIVEIIRPRAGADADLRSYQETGLVFNVGRSTTGGAQGTPAGVYHQTPTIIMRNGDVWWRRVPVNLQPFAEGYFSSLIPDTVEETSFDGIGGAGTITSDLDVAYQPRFRNRYLESKTFTDLFPGADVNGYGKRKFYSPESAEVRRESSITYSDANDFSTRRVRFTSFNPFQAPFKDLPNQYGAINALVEFSEYMFIVQQDKCSVVPINRNILSDASGGEQLISSDKIIGKQKFISGRYGADNNRESVIKVDETVYFAHREKGEVYRYNSGKIEVISRKGVSGFLYDAFQDNIPFANMRVVSGYDPLKDEYIISIVNLGDIAYTAPSLFTQPNPDPFVFDETGDGGGTSGGTLPGGGPTVTNWDTDFGDPMEELVDTEVVTGGTAPDGVSPTGTPGGTIIDTAINNKGDIIDILGGTPRPPFTPITDPKPINDQIDAAVAAGLPSFTLSLSDYIPSNVGDAIGNSVYTLTDGSTVGLFEGANQNIASVTIEEAQQIRDELNQDIGTIVPAEYETYLNSVGTVLGQNLRGILNVRKHELEDVINQAIVDAKTAEVEMISLQKSIPSLFADIQSDLEAAVLTENLTLTTLLAQAQDAYDLLDAYFTDTLQQSTDTTIDFVSSAKPSVSVSGFGLFPPSAFPLEDLQIFQLSFINTLMENIGESVRPLLLLDSVDVSDVLDGFRTANADLRQQVDVLTSQVQNLSAAPVATTGDTFIPNVTTNQVTQQALNTYAGEDGVLTREDVVTKPELTAQIQEIIELYGNTTSVNNTELTDDLALSLAAEIVREIAIQSGATADLYDSHGNPRIPNASDEVLLQNLGNLLNPLDLASSSLNDGFPDGVFGVNDVLSLTGGILYGAPSTESGVQFALSRVYNMLGSSDPIGTYLADVDAGYAGGINAVNASTLERVVVGAMTFQNGTLGNNSSATAAVYSDLEIQHTDFPPPPGGWVAYGGTYYFYDVLGAATFDAVFGAIELPKIKNQDFSSSLSGYAPWIGSSTVSNRSQGGYLPSFNVPLLTRFGDVLTNKLSSAELLTIVQNAIANNQAE